MQIVRDGVSLEVEVVLRTMQALVPMIQFDQTPSYFVVAGLCFTPLTQSYLYEYGRKWYNSAPRPLVELSENGIPHEANEEVVVLSQVLMDDLNVGYSAMAETQVTHVNGTKVVNLKHLKTMVVDAVDRFVASQTPANPSLQSSTLLRRKVPCTIPSEDASIAAVPSSITLEVAEGRVMVIDIMKAVEVHDRLLAQHRIPSDRSVDLES